MQICGRNLVPNGVAYVSYNTYPGWHMRAMLREMMLYHTEGIGDPMTRVKQARGLLKFVAKSATPEDTPHAQYMRQEAKAFENLAIATSSTNISRTRISRFTSTNSPPMPSATGCGTSPRLISTCSTPTSHPRSSKC